MTVQIISYKCEKCGYTYADIKSATMCEEQHAKRNKKVLFLAPDEYYRKQANGRKTDEIKS